MKHISIFVLCVFFGSCFSFVAGGVSSGEGVVKDAVGSEVTLLSPADQDSSVEVTAGASVEAGDVKSSDVVADSGDQGLKEVSSAEETKVGGELVIQDSQQVSVSTPVVDQESGISGGSKSVEADISKEVVSPGASGGESSLVSAQGVSVLGDEVKLDSEIISAGSVESRAVQNLPGAPDTPVVVDSVSKSLEKDSSEESEQWVGESVAPVLSHHQLDSIEDGPGNWFFKAQIMKRARLVINEMRKVIERVQGLREPNQKLADALDGRFDVFYNECGFQKGEIAASLKYIKEQLSLLQEGEKSSKKSISPGVAETVKDLELKRDLLRQMEQNFDEIGDSDKTARELFVLFGNELGRVNQYLDIALEKYEEIENTLNDEAAEFNLHAIEAAKSNIENIEQYLTGEFAGFYSRLSSRVDEVMAQVRADLQKLRDMGIELNRKIREERARQEAERLEVEKKRKQAELKKIEDAKFLNKVRRWGQSAWDWVLGTFSSMSESVRKLFSEKAKSKADAAS